MDADKLRNLTDTELQHQSQELNDQLFRLKFQLKMGQTESLNKIRGLRKDVARINTIMREKQLGVSYKPAAAKAAPAEKSAAAAPASAPAKAAKPAKTKAAAAPKSKAKAAKPVAKARKK
jgi:large subunit ribosomal protein L29